MNVTNYFKKHPYRTTRGRISAKCCQYVQDTSIHTSHVRCTFVGLTLRELKYSDTSANEDNSFRNHIRWPKRDVIRRLTSRCLERKQPSQVGGSPLCDVVSSFLCLTHADGKDKLLEWSDRSCLLLYVSARIH